jgi:predicted NACHT family NTPase
MHIEDFSQLPPEYECLLNTICELAFNATSLSKQIFKYSELVKGGLIALASDGKASTDKDGLGLIVINCYISRYGHDETYTFLHLTFQEYLSALYLNKLSPP